MNRCRLLLWVLLAGLLAPAGASGTLVDRIVAVVNEDIITLSELDSAFEPYSKRIRETYRGPDMEKVIADSRNMMLNRMIDNRLIQQRAAKTGIAIKDQEITDTIRDLLNRRGVPMSEFVKALDREGSNLQTYRQEMKDQMIRMRLLRRELRAKIVVSDEEIGAHYAKHRHEYEGKATVRIMQILIPLPRGTDPALQAKLQAEAEDIHRRLLAGEPFDLLAARYSQGPSAATGGDIGFVEKGVMLPEVNAAAFRLEKDQISPVIISEVGFHIIKVIDRRGAGAKPIEIVREEIKARLEEEKMEKGYEEWIADLRRRSHIEIRR